MSHHLAPRARRLGPSTQQGAIAVVFAVMLAVILGVCGFALDIGQMTNRQTELQGLAKIAALSAARELNGTAAGVTSAATQAASVAGATFYRYHTQPVAWNANALTFSASAYGPWLDVASALAAPNGLLFAKVDTGALDAAHGMVALFPLRLPSSSSASATLRATAIAGRSSVNLVPMALCALSSAPAVSRTSGGNVELVEFGFRRGVGYDLMQLNPAGTTPEHYAIDPFAPPGTAGAAANMAPAILAPFVCSGTLAMPRVTGGAITASKPFPLAALFPQFNSRFDQYAGSTCTPGGAPPDRNIKSYAFGAVNWMTTAPNRQAARSTTVTGKLWTVADPPTAPAGTLAADYGPLWTYARAVPFASYAPGAGEPANGYASFATSTWATLYNTGQPTANASYPGNGSTPYNATSGVNYAAPSVLRQPGVANRRVLHIPLIACPVASGPTITASVIGIGKFFMTVPATATTLFAEFAGAADEQSLGGAVELSE